MYKKDENTALALAEDKEEIRGLLREDIPEAYRAGVNCFLAFLGDQELSFESVKAFGEYLREPHAGRRYSAATINVYIAAVVQRIQLIIKKKTAQMNYAQVVTLQDALKNLKREKIASVAVEEDQVLSYAEIRKLIAECPAPAICLMMEFLAYSAVRVSEMLQVLLSDLAGHGEYTEIRIRGKGAKERKIRVETEMLERIRKHFAGVAYLFEHHGRAYTRALVTMRIKEYGRKILGREISAHTFRHSWATHAIKKGARTNSVQEQLGHSNPATTLALYVHDRFTWKEQKDLFRE